MSLTFSGISWSSTDEERAATIKALEKKIAKVEKKSKKRTKSFSKKFDKYLQRIKFNGFASAGISTSDVEANHIIGINDSKNYQSDAIIALQANFRVNDKTEAVLQLSSRGSDRNDTEAEWAYIAYSFTPNLTVRAGRLRVPYYVASEYIEVGYAYPWVRPPIDIYNQAPFTSYYGIDSFINFELLGWGNTLQVFNGTDFLDLDVVAFTISQMYGAYFTTTKGPWNIRFGRTLVKGTTAGAINFTPPDAILTSSDYTDFKESLNPLAPNSLVTQFDLTRIPADQLALLLDANLEDDGIVYPLYLVNQLYQENQDLFGEDFTDGFFGASAALEAEFDLSGIKVTFDNFGVSYDDGNWLGLVEFTRLFFSGEFQAVHAHYATVGKRFNRLMPFATYAHAYTPNDTYLAHAIGHLVPDLINGLGFNLLKQKTYTAGVRWDVSAGMALKLQIDHMTDMEGTKGKFSTDPGNDADLFSLVVDVVF